MISAKSLKRDTVRGQTKKRKFAARVSDAPSKQVQVGQVLFGVWIEKPLKMAELVKHYSIIMLYTHFRPPQGHLT